MSNSTNSPHKWAEKESKTVYYKRSTLLGHGELTAVHAGQVVRYDDFQSSHTVPIMHRPTEALPLLGCICIKEFSWSNARKKQRMDALFELRLLSAMNHPSIVRMHVAGFHVTLSESEPFDKSQEIVSLQLLDPIRLNSAQMKALAADSFPYTSRSSSPSSPHPQSHSTSHSVLRAGPLSTPASPQSQVLLCVIMELCLGSDVDRLLWELAQRPNPTLVLPSLLPPAPSIPKFFNKTFLDQGASDYYRCGLSETVCWVYLSQLVTSLAYLHCRDKVIVHRDVKPSNVYLRSDLILALGDFGIAAPLPPGVVATGPTALSNANSNSRSTVVGTPAFLSPELLRGGGYNVSSDVWSIGVLMIQLITGKPLFKGDNIASLSHSILSFQHTHRYRVSDELNNVVAALLCVDAAKRPHTYSLLTHPIIVQTMQAVTSTIMNYLADGSGGGEMDNSEYNDILTGLMKEKVRVAKWHTAISHSQSHPRIPDWATYWRTYSNDIRVGEDHYDSDDEDEADAVEADRHGGDHFNETFGAHVFTQMLKTPHKTRTKGVGKKRIDGLMLFGDDNRPPLDLIDDSDNGPSPFLPSDSTDSYDESQSYDESPDNDALNDPAGFAALFNMAKTGKLPPGILKSGSSGNAGVELETSTDSVSDDDDVLNNPSQFAALFNMAKTMAIPTAKSVTSPTEVHTSNHTNKTGDHQDSVQTELSDIFVLDDPEFLRNALLQMKTMHVKTSGPNSSAISNPSNTPLNTHSPTGNTPTGNIPTGNTRTPTGNTPTANTPNDDYSPHNVLNDPDAFSAAFKLMKTMAIPTSYSHPSQPHPSQHPQPSPPLHSYPNFTDAPPIQSDVLSDPESLLAAFKMMKTMAVPLPKAQPSLSQQGSNNRNRAPPSRPHISRPSSVQHPHDNYNSNYNSVSRHNSQSNQPNTTRRTSGQHYSNRYDINNNLNYNPPSNSRPQNQQSHPPYPKPNASRHPSANVSSNKPQPVRRPSGSMNRPSLTSSSRSGTDKPLHKPISSQQSQRNPPNRPPPRDKLAADSVGGGYCEDEVDIEALLGNTPSANPRAGPKFLRAGVGRDRYLGASNNKPEKSKPVPPTKSVSSKGVGKKPWQMSAAEREREAKQKEEAERLRQLSVVESKKEEEKERQKALDARVEARRERAAHNREGLKAMMARKRAEGVKAVEVEIVTSEPTAHPPSHLPSRVASSTSSLPDTPSPSPNHDSSPNQPLSLSNTSRTKPLSHSPSETTLSDSSDCLVIRGTSTGLLLNMEVVQPDSDKANSVISKLQAREQHRLRERALREKQRDKLKNDTS